MILRRVTLNNFFLDGVASIAGRKSDNHRTVFTDHPIMLERRSDSEPNIIRLLSGHLTHIINCSDHGRPKNYQVITLPYMVNKLYGFGTETYKFKLSAATTHTSLASTSRYPDGVVRGSKTRVTKSPMTKKKVVGLRLEIEKMPV